MIIDIGQKVLEVEVNFKVPHGDVVILKVPKEGKTYKEQIPKAPKTSKITIISKSKEVCIGMEIGPQLNKTMDAKVYVASFSMFNNSTFQPTNAKVNKFDGT
jgi:hypothetical protein